jgi:polyhydroxyalkanoate synthesis regulator phasin
MAQEGGDDGGTSFIDRVAAKLGIETQQLEQAVEDARTDQINEAVADGDITQEQADRLMEKLEGEMGLFGPAFSGHGEFSFEGDFWFGPGGFHGRGELGLGPALGPIGAGEELATFLGITQQQLRQELSADGATIASVAEAHGKSRDELKTWILGEAQARLDERVADGDITQERADEVMENLESNVDGLIDGGRFKFNFGGDGPNFGFGPHFGTERFFGLFDAGEELAAFLGIEQEQLLEELTADGASLGSVAEAHGKSTDELKTWMLGEAKARLDEAVADGDITQERADEAYARFENSIDDLIERDFGMKFRFRFGGDDDGDDQDDDDGNGSDEQDGATESFFRS